MVSGINNIINSKRLFKFTAKLTSPFEHNYSPKINLPRRIEEFVDKGFAAVKKYRINVWVEFMSDKLLDVFLNLRTKLFIVAHKQLKQLSDEPADRFIHWHWSPISLSHTASTATWNSAYSLQPICRHNTQKTWYDGQNCNRRKLWLIKMTCR